MTTSRRNSFAAANKSQAHPGRKRRAHSIAPGDQLSPAARARRSLAPRKSILKAAIVEDGDDVTQSMDITRDFREDNPRKSLGRRVSFANHAHVRLFEVPDRNTNSTTSPQSSPAESEPDAQSATNDENAYPGAQRFRRRSSARHSVVFNEDGGEESMDMDSDDTGFSPSAFFKSGADNSMGDEFNDADSHSDGDDMDVTEVVPRDIVRKRSLSFGVSRKPLATLSIPQSPPSAQGERDVPNETSYVEEESAQSQSFTSEGDISQPMEFTVPLVRPSQPPSEAWLALRSVTHSGNTPYIPSSDDDGEGEGDAVQEMELTDAVSRLQAARASLGLGEAGGEGEGEHSFTSTEDSFMEEDMGNDEDGNQTVNVTQLMRRVSIGQSADSTVTSISSGQEQSKEEVVNQPVSELTPSIPVAGSQEIYPAVPESPLHAAIPADSQVLYPTIPTDDDPIASSAILEPISLPDRPPVFSLPQPASPETQPLPSENPSRLTLAQGPSNSVFTPKSRGPAPTVRSRSSSPAKLPPSPKKFTAAFAPPVARPSPQKRVSDNLGNDHAVEPSPAKRPVITERLSLTPGRGTGAVRVLLSPTPLQLTLFHAEAQTGAGPSKRTSTGFRRPSGYFTQRKSLGNAFPEITNVEELSTQLSPSKGTTASLGQKSVGTVDGSPQKGPINNHELTPPIRANHSEQPSEPPPSSIPIPESSHREDSPISGDRATQLNPDDTVSKGEEGGTDDSHSRISIEQFFGMTGIRFMDEIAAPRRSIVHPSALRPSRRTSTEAQIPLSEYVIAMTVNVPQLELYNHVSKDLQTWVERIKEIHREAEEEAQKVTPPLFQEFFSTDESGQAELLHQLKLIKAHNHAQAKSEWYDWKTRWVEQLYQKAGEGFKKLEADAKTLEDIIRRAQAIVPGLQKEFDELVVELAKEKAEIAELEECDQNYLNELKTTLTEQSAELDTFDADVEEAKTKLDRLQEKLSEVESQKREVMTIVQDAERRIHLQKNSTRAEIFQLKDELEALQSLHAWKITRVLPELFECTYASTYFVSIPCIEFRPVVAGLQITRVENTEMGHKEIPHLSALMLRTAKQLVTQQGDQGLRQIVQSLGEYWSSCSQLQAQLKLISIKFPLSIEETPTGFFATATILFPGYKAKALLSFIFDTPIFSSWPMLINSMPCDVKVAYGSIDRDVILNAVTTRIAQASPISNHGSLLDACMEATECLGPH